VLPNGYRRIHVLLRREGWRVNAKRVWRLCREMSLQLRNKPPKLRVQAKLREDRAGAVAANEVWRWTLSTTNSSMAARSVC
jgi:putative transposase